MRLWKQPVGVWILGGLVAATAARAEARSQKQLPSQPRLAQGEIVDDFDMPTEAVDITPAPDMEAQSERNAPGFNPAGPADTMAAPQGTFADSKGNLWRCKYQVAMEQRKPPTEVIAGRALLRFEIDAAGKPVSPTVVALEPATPDVLTCVSREIQTWQLSPPPGQTMQFEEEVNLAGPAGTPE